MRLVIKAKTSEVVLRLRYQTSALLEGSLESSSVFGIKHGSLQCIHGRCNDYSFDWSSTMKSTTDSAYIHYIGHICLEYW